LGDCCPPTRARAPHVRGGECLWFRCNRRMPLRQNLRRCCSSRRCSPFQPSPLTPHPSPLTPRRCYSSRRCSPHSTLPTAARRTSSSPTVLSIGSLHTTASNRSSSAASPIRARIPRVRASSRCIPYTLNPRVLPASAQLFAIRRHLHLKPCGGMIRLVLPPSSPTHTHTHTQLSMPADYYQPTRRHAPRSDPALHGSCSSMFVCLSLALPRNPPPPAPPPNPQPPTPSPRPEPTWCPRCAGHLSSRSDPSASCGPQNQPRRRRYHCSRTRSRLRPGQCRVRAPKTPIPETRNTSHNVGAHRAKDGQVRETSSCSPSR
jgi:hypothetical protein